MSIISPYMTLVHLSMGLFRAQEDLVKLVKTTKCSGGVNGHARFIMSNLSYPLAMAHLRMAII
jgi:hypothetical protein